MTGPDKQEKQVSTNHAKRVKKPLWRRLFKWGLILGAVGTVSAVIVVVSAIVYYGRDLPDYRQLANYEPAVVTRVHAGDGSLLTEFSKKPRLFVPINVVPQQLINAFLSAEDKNYYNHSGLDYMGMVRANLRNVMNLARGRTLQGGSTITQQVARNFLLTLEQRLDRKVKEMILTLRIERAFTKDEILELYLNEINFGNRSYGIAAASLNYFNKALNELTVAEMAFLAALPKAPNNYHPVRNKGRAVGRRNWVLSRMRALDHIDDETYRVAVAEDLVMRRRTGRAEFKAEYFSEEVRRRVGRIYGTKALYEGGLSVRTSLEPRLQAIAERSLRQGLVEYDRRHDYRGPITRMKIDEVWQKRLEALKKPLGIPRWKLAAVHEVRTDGAIIGLRDGSYGFVPFETVTWARRSPKITDIGEVIALGDVIAVEYIATIPTITLAGFWDAAGEEVGPVPQYGLRQIPAVEGANVVMDPHTGRVLAMVGGYDYKTSQYNRATQAERQPGSAYKPFVYATALDRGFTPSDLILDAAFVIDQGEGLGKYKPKNSSNKFYGPRTLRFGIEKSKNLMTVRLAQELGMRSILDYASKFGLESNMDATLAASLGAGEVTLLKLSAAYGMLVNGGKEITPSLIDRIQDRRGKTIFKHDKRICRPCEQTREIDPSNPLETALKEPDLPDERLQLIDPHTAYQLVSMMEGVVRNGTGRSINSLNKPLAGKTGTTNDQRDAWFMGFSADLVVGVYTGFDRPRSLGRYEEGSSVAAPIFKSFMRDALRGEPGIPFRKPAGIRLVRINADTGQPAQYGDKNVILEAYKPGTEPRTGLFAVLDGSQPAGKSKSTIRKGTGGIY
ncbi:MAG: penicillin-binding protein [Kordiimonadales bacterium]|nr:MAG: penicillin-binding protein [Kordiimonadales bacterium]